jgi:hypothetical protein
MEQRQRGPGWRGVGGLQALERPAEGCSKLPVDVAATVGRGAGPEPRVGPQLESPHMYAVLIQVAPTVVLPWLLHMLAHKPACHY